MSMRNLFCGCDDVSAATDPEIQKYNWWSRRRRRTRGKRGGGRRGRPYPSFLHYGFERTHFERNSLELAVKCMLSGSEHARRTAKIGDALEVMHAYNLIVTGMRQLRNK